MRLGERGQSSRKDKDEDKALPRIVGLSSQVVSATKRTRHLRPAGTCCLYSPLLHDSAGSSDSAGPAGHADSADFAGSADLKHMS